MDVRECQNEEPYTNCTTRSYLRRVTQKCGCLPFALGVLEVKFNIICTVSHKNDTFSSGPRQEGVISWDTVYSSNSEVLPAMAYLQGDCTLAKKPCSWQGNLANMPVQDTPGGTSCKICQYRTYLIS